MSHKFRNNLEAQGEYARATDKFLDANTPQWEQLARALTVLGVKSLTINGTVIDEAETSSLASLRPQETKRGQNIQNHYKQQILSASQLLRETLGERSSLDLKPQREACFQAVDTWLQGVHSAFIHAHQSASPAPAQDHNVADRMLEVYQQVLSSWNKCSQKSMDAWAADLQSRQRLCDLVTQCNLLSKTPSPADNRETWLTWAQGTEDKEGFIDVES